MDNLVKEPFDRQLGEAAQKAAQPRWLGDYKIVDSLLRMLVNDVLGTAHPDESSFVDAVEKHTKATARILLGEDPAFPGPQWNSPGNIDVYVGRQEGIQSDDPVERVAGGLMNMVSELYDLIGAAQERELLDEQWLPEVNEIIRQYTCVMMGLPQSGYSQPPLETVQAQVQPSPFAD